MQRLEAPEPVGLQRRRPRGGGGADAGNRGRGPCRLLRRRLRQPRRGQSSQAPAGLVPDGGRRSGRLRHPGLHRDARVRQARPGWATGCWWAGSGRPGRRSTAARWPGQGTGTDLDPAACALAERLGVERAVPRNASVGRHRCRHRRRRRDAASWRAAAASKRPDRTSRVRLARDRARVVLVGHAGPTLPETRPTTSEIDLRVPVVVWSGTLRPGGTR